MYFLRWKKKQNIFDRSVLKVNRKQTHIFRNRIIMKNTSIKFYFILKKKKYIYVYEESSCILFFIFLQPATAFLQVLVIDLFAAAYSDVQ